MAHINTSMAEIRKRPDQAAIREQDLLGGDGVFAFGEENAWVEPRRFFLGARLSF